MPLMSMDCRWGSGEKTPSYWKKRASPKPPDLHKSINLNDMCPTVLKELKGTVTMTLKIIFEKSQLSDGVHCDWKRSIGTGKHHSHFWEMKTQGATGQRASHFCPGRSRYRSSWKTNYSICGMWKWSETASTTSSRTDHTWKIRWPSIMERQNQWTKEGQHSPTSHFISKL